MSASTISYTSSRQQRELLVAAMMERIRRHEGVDTWADHLLLWTMRHRIQLKPGVTFDLRHHKYLEAIYSLRARKAVIYKAGQMGASEYGISYALHVADQRDGTILYLFPTDTHVSDFSAARLGTALEASPYLDRIVVSGGGATASGQRKRGADRVTLKRVRDRFIYFRGAQVSADGRAPQLKSIDADALILDELDEMDPRAPEIAEKRLGHSELKEIRYISTPTYSDVGIHAKWKQSDQREWHVKCDHCGAWQPLTIDQVVTEWDTLGRPVRWHGQGENRAFVACKKCGGELDRLGPGAWVPGYPERDMVGFHLSKLFSATTPLVEVVKNLDTTDETRRKEAYNQDLGLPYTPPGGRMTDSVLDDCRRQYAHGPVQFERPVLGADVGKVIHVVIRGERDSETGEWRQRWAGAVDSFTALSNLIRKFHVTRAVIDALPETRKCRELQRAHPGVVWLAYYPNQRVGSKRRDPVQIDHANGVVNMDRTRTLDRTFARFYEQQYTLPASARNVPDYYDHLKAPVRVLEDGPGGIKVPRYVESSDDHLAHAENYCTAAIALPEPRSKQSTSHQG